MVGQVARRAEFSSVCKDSTIGASPKIAGIGEVESHLQKSACPTLGTRRITEGVSGRPRVPEGRAFDPSARPLSFPRLRNRGHRASALERGSLIGTTLIAIRTNLQTFRVSPARRPHERSDRSIRCLEAAAVENTAASSAINSSILMERSRAHVWYRSGCPVTLRDTVGVDP
jgi:hypothetical protein